MTGLLIGRSQKWTAQSRDAGRVSLWEALWRFWPQTLFGLALFYYAWPASPLLVILSLPLTLGFVLAIPFAVLTAQPEWGMKMRKSGLVSIPEEIDPPQVLEALSFLGPDRHRT